MSRPARAGLGRPIPGTGGSSRDLDASKVVASFDSASVLHAATVAALDGRPFPHLGNGPATAAAVRLAGQLPWPILRRLYTRIGASEGIPVRRLGDVDMDAVAASFADACPDRRYPAIMIGSSNGAMAHLAAALQVPWLPDTVLIPVAHAGRRDQPEDAMAFGAAVAGPLLNRNPQIALHHMHDPVQDTLMSREMSYFRVKWTEVPDAYTAFIGAHLEPGGRLLLINDRSSWPVTRVGTRHVFQGGGQGGVEPEELLRRPHTPGADEQAPEAEWGLPRPFVDDLLRLCSARGIPVTEIAYGHPQHAAEPVAEVLRDWFRQRGEPGDRLVVPSFILGDPWTSINKALTPYWTFFPVQPALNAFSDYLDRAEPYADVHLFLFQHGVMSEGIATPDEFCAVARDHGATPHLEAVRRSKFPHDIGSLGRYGDVFAQLPAATHPWAPLDVDKALRGLRTQPVLTISDHDPRNAESAVRTRE
jgi:hypothetical protein